MPETEINAEKLLDGLRDHKISRFAGVACSVLEPLIASAEEREAYLPASVEGEAVAVAAGAWLAGETAAVMLQNSGLGNAVNPLASLLLPYAIPVLFVISWRGGPGKTDAAQHKWMGEATLPLLELFRVQTWTLEASEQIPEVLEGAAKVLLEGRPAALVVPRGVLKSSSARPRCADTVRHGARRKVSPVAFQAGSQLTRAAAVKVIADSFRDVATVSTTGYISRDLASYGPRPNHFYMQGSMGFALGVGLGAAWAGYSKPLLVLDGDGALIMRLGSLATAGSRSPENLIHIVLDNGTYGSTGGQPTASPYVDFCVVAQACGYPLTACCSGDIGLNKALDWIVENRTYGPKFLRVRISPQEERAVERPDATPPQIAMEFRRWMVASG